MENLHGRALHELQVKFSAPLAVLSIAKARKGSKIYEGVHVERFCLDM